MAEMLGSAVAQETVSRAVSFIFSKHEEKASRAHNIERLEMASSKLELALEISNKLPIIDTSLLRRRAKLKRVREECGDVLYRCKLRVLEDQEDGGQGVTARVSHAVKLRISSWVRRKEDELGGLRRFEWYANEARDFVRDVESGCSLRQYRFISPLVRPLLQGKALQYEMVQGSRRLQLGIDPLCSEGRGAEAWLCFRSTDLKTPTKRSFDLQLMLRLSESTDMVGIATECLQSLGPPFKSVAESAMGELAQLPAQDVLHSDLTRRDLRLENLRPDPLCCRANAHSSPCANNSISSSEISYRFPEQIGFVSFMCFIPAFDEHNLQISSPDGAARNVVARNGSPLELTAIFVPHKPHEVLGDSIVMEEIIGGRDVPINGGSLREMEEMVGGKAIDYFVRQPELTEYWMHWHCAHGGACVRVQKPITESKGRPKTRRVAKRRK